MSTSPVSLVRPPRWPIYLTRAGLWTIAVGIVVALLSGQLNRFSLAGLGTAFMTLLAGLGLTVIGTAVGIVGMAISLLKHLRIARIATGLGIVAGLGVTAYVCSWIVKANSAPPIHDITTDLTDPPSFVAVLPLRERTHAVNPPGYVRQMRIRDKMIDVPQLQREYYPDIKPLQLALPPQQALAKARAVAGKMGWRIDADVPSQGRLEATAHTFFFDFKDDVVVRVTPRGGGSRVDVRSESRVGGSDVGTNAARIRRFLQLMQQP
jgi:uncharacterized protein (DUF1499 family)/disulfide bond formation protein DsbB